MEALGGIAKEAGAVTTLTHPCLCEEAGIKAVRDAAAEHSLDGVLIAACSERSKREAFRGFEGDDKGLYRVSLREQVAWSHPAGEEDTRMLAEDLLRMGVVRLQKTTPTRPLDEEVDGTVLVVGGGRAGMEAALAAADLGHPVVLVEAQARLGGHLAMLSSLVPVRAPYATPQPNDTDELVSKVLAAPDIRVLTSSKIARITGQPGQFHIELSNSECSSTCRVGAIVQATGARSYDPKRLGHLGYGVSPDVITADELEAMLVRGAVVRPSDARTPKRIVFIQCAGSRDPEHLPYCSSECCATTLRQVSGIHSANPEIETVVVYRDMRTPGQLERFYLAVQEQAGVLLTRGETERVEANGKLRVHLKDSLLGDAAVLEADLVVLATGMVPNSADGEAIRELIDARKRAETSESKTQREESCNRSEQLAHHEGTEILNLVYRQGPDMPALRYGFPDSHFICFPYETRRTGIYAAGAVHAPMSAAEAAEDGWGAAMKAVQCIEAARRHEAVHPRAGERAVPDFFLQRCTQCKRCTEECPFGTLDEDEKGTPELQPLRCRRCGICMGACPERIINFPDCSVDMVASMIKAIHVPEEYDEKPRILALLCENDALPALDAAAAQGRHWNPWVRVIPIRCLGSINIVWIAEALGRGIDGMILIGCKYGDDYQCHYVRGSELANTRVGNVGETLQRLVLEAERLKVVQLAHDEFERIPEVLDGFAKELEDLGASPLKGF